VSASLGCSVGALLGCSVVLLGHGVGIIKRCCWSHQDAVLASSRGGVAVVRTLPAIFEMSTRHDTIYRGEQQREDKECMNRKDEQWFIGSIYCGRLVESWMNKTRMKGLLPLGKARQEGVYVESGASKTSTLEAE